MTATPNLAPISCWYTDTGIMLAITQPGDDVAHCVSLPYEYARDTFLTSVLEALRGHEEHVKLVGAVDAAIIDGSLPDDPDD